MPLQGELSVPKGHGIVRVSHSLRHHVPAPLWGVQPGTDFWLLAGHADPVTASGATNILGLDSYGWTITSIVDTHTTTGDFFSSADDTPMNWSANAASDVLGSPLVFGNYTHRLAAAQFLGYLPTRFVCEFYGAFLTASADEAATFIGMFNSALVGAVYSDATNFRLSNASATDAGAAVDNAYHLWRIVFDSASSLMTWYDNDVSQGTVAIKADGWPAGFGFSTSTTNRPALAFAHLWYE